MTTGETGTGGEVAAADRTRRRFLRRRRARRWQVWRRVLLGLLVAAVVLAGGYVVYFSDVFAVEGAAVSGNEQVSTREVLAAARVPTGGSLARVDLTGIERRVAALAAVGEVEVTRHWPHEVQITVSERVPVAVVERGGQWRAVDADGVVFEEYDKPPTELPRITTTGSQDSDALAEAASVAAALPSVLARLTDHLELSSADDVELALRDGRQVRWGSAGASEQKARVLMALLGRPGQYFDVSAPGQPAVADTPPAS